MMFPCLNDFIENQEMDIELIKSSISDNLNSLKNNFIKYFLPDVDASRFDWFQNPFTASADTVHHLPVKAQKEFTDLSANTQLKMKFQKQPLSTFWLDIKLELPLWQIWPLEFFCHLLQRIHVNPRFQLHQHRKIKIVVH